MDGPEALDDGEDGGALQKVLQAAGLGTRRQLQGWIADGRVAVNGVVVTRYAEPVEPTDVVTVDDEVIVGAAAPIVYLMHKPKKHLTMLVDPEGKPALAPYLPASAPFVFPVGRLDYNSEGALLFTNDGGLARRILHPDWTLPKWYALKLRGEWSDDHPGLCRMREGMTLASGESYLPADVEAGESRSRATWVHITITEGKHRQLRKMCAEAGFQVVKLRRMAVGPVMLGELNPRCVREVIGLERDALYRAVGLAPPRTP